MLADLHRGAWSDVGRKLMLFHPCPAGRLAPGSALVLSAAKLPQEAHVTGKVTSGRTRSIQSGPSQSPYTETEVRLNGTAVGRIISRANPKLSGLLEYQVQIEGEPSTAVTTLASARALAHDLLVRRGRA
jgi:hypothetical protein